MSGARKELLRMVRDPVGLLAWLGIPIFVALAIGLLFGGRGGGRPQGLLLVADEDKSFLSNAVTAAFGQGPMKEMVKTEEVEAEAGRKRIEEGGASALLEIPKGFGEAVLKQEKTGLRLTMNPAQRIMPGMIRETLELLAEGAFYVQQIAGEELKAIQSSSAGGSIAAVPQIAMSMSKSAQHAGAYLNPVRIEVETKVESTSRTAGMNMGELFFPGMLYLGVMFAAAGLSDDVWKEKLGGTLRRAAVTPRGLWALLAAKVAAIALLLGMIAAVGMVMGWVLGIPADRIVVSVTWIVVSGTGLYLIFVVLQSLASTQRGGGIVVNLVVFPLTMVGGSFFPFEAMPAWMAAVGKATPNGWSVEMLKRLISGDPDWGRVGMGFAAWAAAGAVMFWAAGKRIRRQAQG